MHDHDEHDYRPTCLCRSCAMERAYLDGADVAMAQATLSDLIARIDLEAERYATE